MKFNWECPFCNHKTVVFDGENGTVSNASFVYSHTQKYPHMVLSWQFIGCPNEQCAKFSLTASLMHQKWGNPVIKWVDTDRVQHWNLIPQSSAKAFPDYIPEILRNDYHEACLIRDLSPKASATLSRRCLQGMIRDFWKITKGRLIDEIKTLESIIDKSTWEAIDGVRQVGNIGAHMEKDINLIVDVDPDEAQMLIGLLETLFEEWYIAKHDKDEKMAKIKNLATSKKADKSEPTKPS